MKDIKDYLHLYLGCEVASSEGTATYILTGVTTGGGALFRTKDGLHSIDLGHDFRLILRPLSDMTEDERIKVALIVCPGDDPWWVKHMANTVKWYLANHFDLFGLIPAGLAIDKTQIAVDGSGV